MDKLVKKRSVLRSTFTKLQGKISQSLHEDNPDEIDIKASCEILREKHDEIAALNEEILTIMHEENVAEEKIEEEYDVRDKYSLQLKKLEHGIARKFDKLDNASSSNTNIQAITKRRFKLPQLELNKFNGDLKEWLPFWNQFKQIHEDESVPAVEKFQYLKQCTVVGSRARALIESFPATDENYEKAVDSLKARFGRVEMLVEVYGRELLKLVLKNVCSTAGKVSIVALHDQLESHLRSLESLGITDDKFDAMLYPLVESSLPEDILRIWQRSTSSVEDIITNKVVENTNTTDCNPNTRLNKLMNFLKREIENEEKVSLAKTSFGVEQAKRKTFIREEVPTAVGLLSTKERDCIFCNKIHANQDCNNAKQMSYEEKKNILRKKGCCFVCLKFGHISRTCRHKIQCERCSKRHYEVMCFDQEKRNTKPTIDESNSKPVTDTALANFNSSPDVSLQILKVIIRGEESQRVVRAIIDMGSQRSYILKKTAIEMKYLIIGEEKLRHGLFGGMQSKLQAHNCYMLKLSNIEDTYRCHFQVLDQPTICNTVNPVKDGPWTEELRHNKIHLTDMGESKEEIEVLIGADVAGRLLTGNQHILTNGMVAIETHLGWTIVGKIRSQATNTGTPTITSLLAVDESDISKLWQLDVIGIEDPIEQRSRKEMDDLTKMHFLETVSILEDGRYEVHMPWLEGHPPLPTNYKIAVSRLHKLLQKLKDDGMYEDYRGVLQEWLDEGIIEEVPKEEYEESGHYMPHRHVVKNSSTTTRIRPVFDASAKEPKSPSLNQCLEKGGNLVEHIPRLLIKFRLNEIGVLADIKKAFLQIQLCKNDRNYLRFLWSEDFGRNIKIFRHARVVFGVTCSPFLLGAVIEYHLERCLKKCAAGETNYSQESIRKLIKGMYVDNAVTSVSNKDELNVFIREAREIMAEAKFDLRNWEFNSRVEAFTTTDSAVLGLRWDKVTDVLYINPECLEFRSLDKVTKRVILSIAHKVYDPIGFSCPVSLCPKLLLKRIWEEKLRWDTEVSPGVKWEFLKWVENLSYLRDVKIPRWFGGKINEGTSSIHVFTDASGVAYAAVVFLRIQVNEIVKVQLIQARTRITPTKKISIPRLELLAATIGARLYADVTTDSVMSTLPVEFWSDSATVIAWIQRDTIWGTFVRNRVEEIRKLTPSDSWRHIPGHLNPADLPSRGCQPKQLLESRWWEGPSWLYQSCSEWPTKGEECDEEEVNVERKRTVVSTLLNKEDTDSVDWFYRYFSKYQSNIRLMGWIHRFKNNCLRREKASGELTTKEIQEAEKTLMILIQQRCFTGENDKNIKSLQPYRDCDGILRLKTKIVEREDDWEFLYPILLPTKHPVVDMLIRQEHENLCHAGGQILLGKLREKFWIIKGRSAIRRIVMKCVRCRRYASKSLDIYPPPLPQDRVRDARAFEITGIDLAGPLFIKGKQKVLNWNEIEQYSSARQIEWKFNPPTASWWGGWWERIIRIIKQLLKRVLSRAALTYEELSTVICDCETTINNRPLTYISENPQDCAPLTPNMFIQDLQETGVPDCDIINHTSFNRRIRYRQKLNEALRQRFRVEYLGQLIQNSKAKETNPIRIGEIVFIGNDNIKKINWPLAKVIKLIPGSDGKIRLVKVRNSSGEFLRPIQRLYPLEVVDETYVNQEPRSSQITSLTKEKEDDQTEVEQSKKSNLRTTRRGRLVKPPQKLNLFLEAIPEDNFKVSFTKKMKLGWEECNERNHKTEDRTGIQEDV